LFFNKLSLPFLPPVQDGCYHFFAPCNLSPVFCNLSPDGLEGSACTFATTRKWEPNQRGYTFSKGVTSGIQNPFIMTRVILTAQVEDLAKWETGFRSHVGLFRSMGVQKAIQYTMVAPNTVAITSEVADIGKYLEMLQSPETAAAMDVDGAIKETVQVFVLDKVVEL
jgi:hypothetical protein